ncbi:MAG: right-handed parallel beta-helix repeat-containing protein [Methylocella sp.]
MATTITVFVSGKGTNSASCGAVATPCLTFQKAHDNTNPGGEIVVLDAASYGPVTITKALGIVDDGAGTADVLQTGAGLNAITINAGASDSVHLHGLSLDGAGAAKSGVRLNSAGSLTIVNCVARHFTNSGFLLAPTGAASFLISNTIASDNGKGVTVFPQGAGSAKGVVDHTTANNNTNEGVLARGGVVMTVVDSVASKNANGIAATIGASITIRETASTNNANSGYGVQDSGSVIRLAHSVASGNNFGVTVASGGVAESFVDNNLRGNTTGAVSGSLTTVLAK